MSANIELGTLDLAQALEMTANGVLSTLEALGYFAYWI